MSHAVRDLGPVLGRLGLTDLAKLRKLNVLNLHPCEELSR
jgi:hypothetical protein